MNNVQHLLVFRQLADALPFGVYVLSLDTTIQYANRATEQITGYLGQEVVGHRCQELLTCCGPNGASVCSASDCPAACALRDGAQSQTRLFVSHKDGERIPIVLRAIPLRDEDGIVIAVAECFREESSCLEDLSWIDEAETRIDRGLGIYSVETTQKQLRSALAVPSAQFAAFLVEIEHLHELALKHGSEMVRVAQRAVIHTLKRILNLPHYLGRWNGDSLLLLVPGCSDVAFAMLQQTLSGIENACAVTWWGDRIGLHVVAGSTLSRENDTPEAVAARLFSPAANIGEEPGELQQCL